MTFVLSGIGPTSCSRCPRYTHVCARMVTDGDIHQAQPFPCHRSPYLIHPKVQRDICSRTDSWFDLSLSLGKMMFINVLKKQSQLHLAHTWASEKTKGPRRHKPTWAWLNGWTLGCHWVLGCYTSLRYLQGVQSTGSGGRNRFLLFSLKINVLVLSTSPLQGSTSCTTSIFVTLSPPPHRNALRDSL